MTLWEVVAVALWLTGQGQSAARQADEAALLRAHETILAAHRNRDVNAWLATEADTLVVGGRGRVSLSTKADRTPGREEYLKATRFTSYRDLQPPIVRVSKDGTMGWLVAQVEVKGTRRMPDGSDFVVDTVWAWIEMYEKIDGQWRGVGNVSSEGPPPRQP